MTEKTATTFAKGDKVDFRTPGKHAKAITGATVHHIDGATITTHGPDLDGDKPKVRKTKAGACTKHG